MTDKKIPKELDAIADTVLKSALMNWQILHGDVRERLKDIEPSSVQCVVTINGAVSCSTGAIGTPARARRPVQQTRPASAGMTTRQCVRARGNAFFAGRLFLGISRVGVSCPVNTVVRRGLNQAPVAASVAVGGKAGAGLERQRRFAWPLVTASLRNPRRPRLSSPTQNGRCRPASSAALPSASVFRRGIRRRVGRRDTRSAIASGVCIYSAYTMITQ